MYIYLYLYIYVYINTNIYIYSLWAIPYWLFPIGYSLFADSLWAMCTCAQTQACRNSLTADTEGVASAEIVRATLPRNL